MWHKLTSTPPLPQQPFGAAVPALHQTRCQQHPKAPDLGQTPGLRLAEEREQLCFPGTAGDRLSCEHSSVPARTSYKEIKLERRL